MHIIDSIAGTPADRRSSQPFALNYVTPKHDRTCGQENDPHLALIRGSDNSNGGRDLGGFYSECGLLAKGTGAPLLVVLTPMAAHIATLHLGNPAQ